MACNNIYKCLVGSFQKLTFLRGSIRFLLVWPIISLALGALLWYATLSKIDADKGVLKQNALKDASILAQAYGQQLTRVIERVDQITLEVQYDWVHAQEAVKLEELVKAGIFPASGLLFVSIADRKGMLITATAPLINRVNVADREYFLFHQRDKSNILLVGQSTTGRVSGKPVIHFTRRLNTADGSFDGVVIVSAELSYFLSFYQGSRLGKAGLLAMVGKDRALRASSIGASSQALTSPVLNTLPAFGTEEGSRLMSGEQFVDNQARFIAWDTLDAYPFVAMVGLSEEELLAPYRKTWATEKQTGFIASLILFLFMLITTLLSARLVWRKHQAEKARNDYWITTEGGSEGFFMGRAVRDKNGITIDFAIADCNARAAALYGLKKAQLLGTMLSTLYSKPLFEMLMNTCHHAMETGFYEDEYQVPSESPLKISWVYRKLVRTNFGLAVTIRDISEAKAHERELLRLGNEDELTGLPNRHWLVNFLPLALERAKSTNSMLSLLFVDLDGFKDVNDTLGHSAGDELLRAAALRLKSMLRPTDNVVRFGGDEFAVIVEPVVWETKPVHIAERIAAAFNEPFELSRGRHAVGASIGISVFPRDGEDAETLLKNADMAMYSAKNAGKGHYRFYQPELYESLKHRIDTEQALLQALEQDQFILFYQPRMCIVTGELCGMEALVRWMHPTRGLVPPMEFIPLAETTGLIVKLGDLVMEKVCAQIAHWKEQRLPLVPVSVNVSARQFNQSDIAKKIASCLARHELGPTLLEIEITESLMMGEHVDVHTQLSALRTLGIKLLVDDFGTGHSSLSQLQQFDMDVLKVDRAFTAALGETKQGEVFVKAIISMAHALDMTVVAEGGGNRGAIAHTAVAFVR